MKIAFTGGGTGGHVSPGLAIYEELFEKGNVEFFWIGSKNGIEKKLTLEENITYHNISTGKLRRYFDIANFFDIFKIFKGVIDSLILLKKQEPDVLFASGGFVCVPPFIAAKILSIPRIIYNPDYDPGLATKICHKISTKTLVVYPDSLQFYDKQKKVFVVGNPIKKSIKRGKAEKARSYLSNLGHNNIKKKVLLVLGGSLGAEEINELVKLNFDFLSEKFFVIHQTGQNKMDLQNIPNTYHKQSFFSKELCDIFDLTDYAISRAGANTIWELAYKNIPSILVPLSKNSRGDQIKNANIFKKSGFSYVIDDNSIEIKSEKLKYFIDNIDNLKNFKFSVKDSNKKIVDIILNT